MFALRFFKSIDESRHLYHRSSVCTFKKLSRLKIPLSVQKKNLKQHTIKPPDVRPSLLTVQLGRVYIYILVCREIVDRCIRFVLLFLRYFTIRFQIVFSKIRRTYVYPPQPFGRSRYTRFAGKLLRPPGLEKIRISVHGVTWNHNRVQNRVQYKLNVSVT